MVTLQKKIADKYFEQLGQSKDVDAEKIKQLRALLSGEKKPKADDFVKIFLQPPGGDLT
jgi:hypothetical protein